MTESTEVQKQKRWGWVETLVVIAIVMNLVALLLPPVKTAHTSASRERCKYNLRDVGLALHNYADAFHGLPEAVADSANVPRSWRVDLLPYVDQGPLRTRYVDAEMWDSEANRPVAETSLAIYRCPSSPLQKDARGNWFTAFAALTGPHSAFSDAGPINFPGSIPDGTSNTLVVVEACDQRILWTEPRDFEIDREPMQITGADDSKKNVAGGLSSSHKGGAHVMLADGAVRFLTEKLDPNVLKALMTIDGGEKIDPNDF